MRWRSTEHYLKRAQEMREAALAMEDEAARDNLLDLARQYDEMAEKRSHDGKGDGKADGHAKPDGHSR